MLYPILNEKRQLISLDGLWNFSLVDNGQELDESIATKGLIGTEVYQVPVPSSYNDLFESEKFRKHVGWVWYERTFEVPTLLQEQRMVLRFGSVTHEARVFLNGKLITTHKGGFTPFEVQINDYLQPGTNKLMVAVNNIIDDSTLPVGLVSYEKQADGTTKLKNNVNFDFFNYAGIHRPVKLYTTPKEYISDITITSNICADQTADITYDIVQSGSKKVKVTIYDEEKQVVGEANSATGTIKLTNPILWKPLNAYLYQMKVELLATDNSVYDEYVESFGIRTVSVQDGKFLINNKPFYFKGFGKHEDTYLHGRGFDEVANVKDMSLIKWMGANSFRTSHYPYSEEMMRLADREGIVIIDEVPAVGVHLNFMSTLVDGETQRHDTWKEIRTKEAHERVIRELIERDKNHPSVVMWSVANEPDSDSKGAKEYFSPLIDLAKKLDPQKRPVTIVTYLYSTPKVCQVGDIVDVLCLNRYYGWYVAGGDLDKAKELLKEELDGWKKRCPNKPVMFTEFGADTVAGLHDTVPTMFTEEYQIKYYETNCEVIDQYPNFVGEQVWNFADFATSEGILRVQGNKKGIFTRQRQPKMVAHYLRQRWLNIPEFNYKK